MNYEYQIKEILFGLYSADEVRKMSVCEVDNPKKSGPRSVYDPKMGTTDSTRSCDTCHQNAILCPGHFGHIELNEPIVHPMYYKRVNTFLNCFCMKCYRLLITKEKIELAGIHKLKGEKRFDEIVKKISKISVCCQPDVNNPDSLCMNHKNHVTYNINDFTYSVIYENRVQDPTNSKKINKTKTNVPLTTQEILKIFDNIPDEDVELMGFDPKLVHPRNFIIVALPVCPPCTRPYVNADGKTCDDDLTIQYIEIIKANNNLAPINVENEKKIKKELSEQDRIKIKATLRFRISTTFDNSAGKAKHTTNARPIKSIKERLNRKEGQLRSNIMGKRCDQTGRTVIGPDPTLRMGELAVPVEMANILTVPVRVTPFNFDELQTLIDQGDIKSVVKPDEKTIIDIKRFRRGTRLMISDVIYRKGEKIEVVDNKVILQKGDRVLRNGEQIPQEKLKPANRKYKIDIGWIVNVPLRIKNGSYVLLNRQPTLHKASMLAMKVVIKPYKTLRMNLAVTKPFNADFDGDEMNIHIPQSLQAQAELELLSAAKWNFISPQSSKSNMVIVQDSLLCVYKMSLNRKKLTKSQYFDISMKLPQAPWSTYKKNDMMTIKEITDKISHIRKILKEKGKKVQCFNGHGLISLFLPYDFNYEKKNDANPLEPTVKIWRGVFYEGTLDKNIVGGAHNSIQQTIFKEYGASAASHFIDCIHFVTNSYLLIDGFSVGLKDCLISKNKDKQAQIEDAIRRCYIEAEGIKEITIHPNIREIRINAALNKAKDIGLRIAKNALDPDNNFLFTVNSGSKGDYFNIAQITGLLGQQNLKGNRVPLSMNNGKRSLPHYPFEPITPEMEYESRGFISSGFLKGLNPRQFYFHAMSGREGICDTAMGTPTSGYMQRSLVKLTEDIKIQYDGTVRDATGKIYQFQYGDCNFDPSQTINVNGTQEICDVGRLAERLNMNYELSNQKRKK